MNYKITYSDEYLAHHGILGQKWGIRRYRNYDGTYTQAGLKRYYAAKERSDKALNDYKSAKKAYRGRVEVRGDELGAELKKHLNAHPDTKRLNELARRGDTSSDEYRALKERRDSEAYDKAISELVARKTPTKEELRQKKDTYRSLQRETNKHYKHLKLDKLGDQGKDLYQRGKTITGNHAVTSRLATGASLLAYAAYAYGDQKTQPLMYGAAGVLGTMALGKECIDAYQNKRLRAYYAHTSKY